MDISLPSFDLPDGKGKYEPPKELAQAMHLLFSLSPTEYVNAVMYLTPMKFIVEAYRAAQNPVLAQLHHTALMERYWQYHAQVAGMQTSGSKSAPTPAGSGMKQ